MSGADPTLLLRRLSTIARRERELLATGNWELALAERTGFDDVFEQFVALAGTEPQLAHAAREELMTVYALNVENLGKYAELRDTAGAALGELRQLGNASKYAPLGNSKQPAPRYFDTSA
jgi:hypothetical protein